jgi:hypothetical protein
VEVRTQSGVPEGATWIERPTPGSDTEEAWFCALSRGDRVWGRCRFPARASAGSGAVILLSADGDSQSAFVGAALERWGSWVTVASPDLPLCAKRRSEKLSPIVVDREHPLYSRLQIDLTRQLEQDLLTLAGLLAAFRDVHREKTAVVALGMSASLLLPSLEQGGWPLAAAIAPPPEGTELPSRVRAFSMPTQAETDGWLAEVGTYLRTALASAGT